MDMSARPTCSLEPESRSHYDGDIETAQVTPTRNEKRHTEQPMSFFHRIDHATWAWGTLPMSTGGIALLLANQPHTFHGLYTIGVVVFIIDLLFFTLVTAALATRFLRNPNALKRSFQSPTESLFFATYLLALPSIIGCIQKYGMAHTGPWLIVLVRVLFWIYLAIAFITAVAQYLYLFLGRKLTVQTMTPAWLLPVFPAMLCGTVASVIAPSQPAHERMPILVAGATMQGLGFWWSLIVYAIFLSRLVMYGIPDYDLRPGLFITVGPPSFTGLAIIGMSTAIPVDYGYFAAHPTAAETVRTVALLFAIFIWTLASFFFCIAAVSCIIAVPHIGFHLVWWAFIFPNVGYTLILVMIGNQLESEAMKWVGSVMTVLLCAMYIFIFGMMVKALASGEILWPHRDEDKDEYKDD